MFGMGKAVSFTFFKGKAASLLFLQGLSSLFILNIRHCLHVCMLPYHTIPYHTQKNESVVMFVKQRNLSWPRSATGPQ